MMVWVPQYPRYNRLAFSLLYLAASLSSWVSRPLAGYPCLTQCRVTHIRLRMWHYQMCIVISRFDECFSLGHYDDSQHEAPSSKAHFGCSPRFASCFEVFIRTACKCSRVGWMSPPKPYYCCSRRQPWAINNWTLEVWFSDVDSP